MLKLSKKTPPAVGAVIVDMKEGLATLYDARNLSISEMSGYPSAIHAIGRIQRMIKTSSYGELLNSLIKLRDIARVTADVIDSMEGVKTDRFQINRTDIIAYVDNVTSTVSSIVLTDEDKDLIAHIITSFEANSGSWILSGPDDDTNLHVRMRKLYKYITKDVATGALPVYNPHEDKISALSALPNFASSGSKKAKAEKDAADANAKLTSAEVYYKYAAVRIVDHIYSLMTDHDIWYAFVSPRTKAEVSANLERSKSLKVFSLYIQSLLSYNQFFMFETFMKSYDTLSEWISVFVPLSSTIKYNIDNIIRPHDLLGAKSDVDALFNSIAPQGDKSIAAKLIVFPSQSLAAYGLKKTFDTVVSTASSLVITAPFTDLSSLDDKKYLPLLSGVAMQSLNVSHDVTKVILMDKIVGEEVKLALADLVPSLVRGSSKLTISTLEALSLRSPLPFSIPRALSFDVFRGSDMELSSRKFCFDSGAPRFSWDYHKHVRKNYSYKVMDERSLMTSYDDNTRDVMYNRDKAASMRELFGMNWKSLMPSSLSNGSVLYTKALLSADEYSVRNLIEAITGSHYDIVIREMGVAHLRKLWATCLSSFCSLYYNASEEKVTADNLPTLVEGWGKPYGKSYSALATLQGSTVQLTDLISLGAGAYIRMHTKIPKVIDELAYSKDYYLAHPMFYYTSNSGVIEDFEGWIMDDALLHLSMVPVSTSNSIPQVVLSSKFAYLTNSLLINTDLYFKPDSPSPARECVSLPREVRSWPFERYSFYLDYTVFGSYGQTTAVEIIDDKEKIDDVIGKIEEQMEKENKEQQDDKSKVNDQPSEFESKVKEEVDDSNRKKKSPSDDDPNAI